MARNLTLADEKLLAEARQFKDELLVTIFGATAQAATSAPISTISVIPPGNNIVGVGYGTKLAGGVIQEDRAVRVYVRAKLSRSLLSTNEEVPLAVNGVATDVIQVGDIVALQRPTECGVSVGHFLTTAGTLGCLVKRVDDTQQERFILSNNHVLANSNEAKIDDNILHPGAIDGGDPNLPIAKLVDFEPIKLDNSPNFIDAAIAKVININEVQPSIVTIGNVQQPIMPAAEFQSVRKQGRTTQHTLGIITDLSADIRVRFGGAIAFFEDQITITGVNGQFSSGGDSGSLIVDAVTRRPVGLLFAGGGNTTFANPIERVLARFSVDIL